MPEWFQIQIDPLNALISLAIGGFIYYIFTSKIYQSSNDLVLAGLLADAKRQLDEASFVYAASLSDLDLDLLNLKSEDYCKTLELLCKYYMDNKIDQKMFEEIYKNDLKIVSKESFASFYGGNSLYKNTLILYKKFYQ